MLHERTDLSRGEASLRPARALRSRDHLGTYSIRSKLPPPYVPMSPSPVSREASRDLWCSIGPSTMGVFKLRTSASAHALCPKISLTIYVQIPLKTNFIFRHWRLYETAADSGSAVSAPHAGQKHLSMSEMSEI